MGRDHQALDNQQDQPKASVMLWTEREGGSKHMLTGDDVREYAYHEHYSIHNPSYRSMKRSAQESSILCLISE